MRLSSPTATAVAAAIIAAASANDIGMSRQMVERYMRFKDQMEIAAAGATRPRLIEVKG